jgi:hypothetical protein
MSHGPAHHDGGSLAGKDSLFDSSTGSRTGSGSAGLLIGRLTASSSLIATVGRGGGARSGFMSHTMARCGVCRPGSCARAAWRLDSSYLAPVDPRNRASLAGTRAGVAVESARYGPCRNPAPTSHARRAAACVPPGATSGDGAASHAGSSTPRRMGNRAHCPPQRRSAVLSDWARSGAEKTRKRRGSLTRSATTSQGSPADAR